MSFSVRRGVRLNPASPPQKEEPWYESMWNVMTALVGGLVCMGAIAYGVLMAIASIIGFLLNSGG